ncbi:hypothetical protein VTJ04DRAFT_9885 [Mycothermus thermophilus]|uniref:uncharacterized protein n=1 Tax=Humicola insolens TaxID=85995 RepID=UPI0037433C2E
MQINRPRKIQPTPSPGRLAIICEVCRRCQRRTSSPLIHNHHPVQRSPPQTTGSEEVEQLKTHRLQPHLPVSHAQNRGATHLFLLALAAIKTS